MAQARIYGVGFLVMVWFVSHGQSPTIARLRLQLVHTTADSSRSNLCYALGKQYEQINLDSCVYFLYKSVQIAQLIHDPVATTRAMYQLGFTYMYASKDEAKAVGWFNRAIPIAKASNNYACLADCYRLLAICADHQRIGSPDELMNKAIRYAKKSNDWRVLMNTYQVGSVLTIVHENYVSAEKYVVLARTACGSHNLDNWFTCSLDLHDLLTVQGKKAEAQALARELSLVKDKLPKTDGEFVYTNDVAKLEKILKHYALAESILLKGIDSELKRTRTDTSHLFFLYQNILDTYLAQKDWQNAYQYGHKLADIRLWLQQKRQTRDAKLQMTELKATLDIEKKDNQINLLAAQQQQQLVFLIASLLVAVLLVGFIVIQRRNQRRIERQKTELTQLNATKNKLFAILSHDLRSPVANLQSNVMLTNWGGLSQQEFADSTQSLSMDIGYVRTMLDNVLSWSISQMEGMKPRAEPIDMALLMQEQIQLLQPMANTKSIQVVNQIPADAILQADKNHLSIVCRNLLQNALKFTDSGGHVWVKFFQDHTSNQVIIQDTGIGMAPQLLTDLFRLDKQTLRLGTAREQGTGLGLVLVKELVDVNQGTLQVVSEVGKGTTFTLTFIRKPTEDKAINQISPTYA